MKILLACTSGGHFSTMKSLEDFWSSHDRVWVTDYKQDTQALKDRGEAVDWMPYQAPRDVLTLLRNLPRTFALLRKHKPDVVISTGASMAINFAIASRLLGIRFLFIESVSRSEELSISGKLVYPLANEFYVQWPQLCNRYPKAIFQGTVT